MMDESDWKDRFTEISGWLEYDCGLPRGQAEAQARRNLLAEQLAYRKETERLEATPQVPTGAFTTPNAPPAAGPKRKGKT